MLIPRAPGSSELITWEPIYQVPPLRCPLSGAPSQVPTSGRLPSGCPSQGSPPQASKFHWHRSHAGPRYRVDFIGAVGVELLTIRREGLRTFLCAVWRCMAIPHLTQPDHWGRPTSSRGRNTLGG